jgi:hypothetical protein
VNDTSFLTLSYELLLSEYSAYNRAESRYQELGEC